MRLSLLAKYLLIYGLSPFFTGVIVGLVMLLDSSIQNDIISEGMMTYLFESLSKILTLGVIALFIFFIPALIVGISLYYLRRRKIIYQLLYVILIGFMTPFFPLMVFSGFDHNVVELCAFIGLLGATTGFMITLKLIFFPFKDSRNDQENLIGSSLES